MSKDLLADRYGRFYEIPLALKELGHEVFVSCISYRSSLAMNQNQGISLDFENYELSKNPFYGIYTYYFGINHTIEKFKPDIIIGASDCFNIIVAAKLANKHDIPLVVDLYDNFESYKATLIPGVSAMFKYSVNKANSVSVVSDELSQYIKEKYSCVGKIAVIENAVDKNKFQLIDKIKARKKLKLSENGILIGTAGAIQKNRGIDILLKAFNKLCEEHDNINLVLAGPKDNCLSNFNRNNIVYLGNLSYEYIPYFFNAIDVGVICNKDSKFGRYCFPQKAYEMMACKVPIVAANVGAMGRLFQNHPEFLYETDNVDCLYKSINDLIANPKTINIDIPSWSNQAYKLQTLIENVLELLKR